MGKSPPKLKLRPSRDGTPRSFKLPAAAPERPRTSQVTQRSSNPTGYRELHPRRTGAPTVVDDVARIIHRMRDVVVKSLSPGVDGRDCGNCRPVAEAIKQAGLLKADHELLDIPF